MKKNEEDEKKTSDKYQLDFSKFQPFIEEAKSKNLNSSEYIATSVKNSLTPQDSIIYNPKNIHFIQTKYPNSPIQFKTDNMEKFDVDTLFFVFFIQQDPYLRYLAAKELKKRGWMYHNKFYTFFQVQGMPRNKSEEFIEGKFKFFDFEEDWMVRMKKDFKFEFKYLDNIE